VVDIIVIYALLAATFPFEKLGLAYCSALFFCTSRMMVGGCALLAYVYFTDKKQLRWSFKDCKLLVALTICNVFVPHVFPCWSLHYIPTAKAALMYNMTPFFAALYGQFFLQQSISAKKWIGMIIGFCGLYVLVGMQVLTISYADSAIVCAAIIAVFGWQSMQCVSKRRNYTSAMANGISMLLAGLIGLVLVFLVDTQIPTIATMGSALLYILPVTVISNIIAYNYFNVLLKRYSITLVSFVGFVVPIFAAIYGWVPCSEIPSNTFYVSLPIVFMGFIIFYHDEMFIRDIL